MTARETAYHPPNRGLFVCLDGPDGGGKSTQAALLAAWLRARRFEVAVCRDPGGTPLGDRLREILLDRATTNLSLRAEMLLYMASRAQLVEEVIRPTLAAGRIVISDRYLLANLVYQGYAGGLPVEEVWRVGESTTGGLLPDLTLILDVPPEVAQARVGKARDRIEDRSEAYRARVREGFLRAADAGRDRLCASYTGAVVLIDASANTEIVAERIRSEVERALALGPRS